MNMRVETSGCDNLAFTSDDIGAGTDDQVWMDALHDVWVAGFSNTNDVTVLDTDIRFVNTRPVNHQSIGDDRIQGITVRTAASLSHSLAQRFTTTERALIPILSKILLHLDPQVGGTETDEVTGSGSEHADIGLSLHGSEIDVSRVSRRLGHMQEAARLQTLPQALRDLEIPDVARCQVVAAPNDLVASDLNKGDCPGVTRLKPHRCPSGDVETESVSPDAVEFQERVRFDKVVMRANLSIRQPRTFAAPDEASIPGLACRPCL